ncbi:hypothetical protein, partial [Rubrimonas sp.]|uniref:hypothetical protein n=1 Tax=Rubrimonas sp. TaxID=2036015 RepID=UPI002FDE26CE
RDFPPPNWPDFSPPLTGGTERASDHRARIHHLNGGHVGGMLENDSDAGAASETTGCLTLYSCFKTMGFF